MYIFLLFEIRFFKQIYGFIVAYMFTQNMSY
jgi:hypothetical protein